MGICHEQQENIDLVSTFQAFVCSASNFLAHFGHLEANLASLKKQNKKKTKNNFYRVFLLTISIPLWGMRPHIMRAISRRMMHNITKAQINFFSQQEKFVHITPTPSTVTRP